jgi:sugar/nucleoside kinase (ribokinase family)
MIQFQNIVNFMDGGIMKYLTLGSLFDNTINFADQSKVEHIMGATIFAFAGIFLYTDECVLVGGAGTDFEEIFGEWFDKNKASKEGIVIYNNRTVVATMQYFPDGRWYETFEYGVPPEDKEKFNEEFSNRVNDCVGEDTKGIYFISSDANKNLLETIKAAKEKKKDLKVMAEINTAECISENLEYIKKELFPFIDIYSINKPESFSLFSVDSEEEAIKCMQKLGKPCFYRVGKKGSYMVEKDRYAFVPSVHLVSKEEEIDPTGCGNCSTAAALYGFAEGYNPDMVASISNVAASYNVMQYGPYTTFNDRVRKEVLAHATELSKLAVKG